MHWPLFYTNIGPFLLCRISTKSWGGNLILMGLGTALAWSEHQCDRRLSWISLSVKFLPQLLWQACFHCLYGLCEIKRYFSCIFSLQCSPHLFMVRGHLGLLISQMGKKGIKKPKSSFLSQLSMRTTGFQTFSIPCLRYFFTFFSPTHYSILSLRLSHSLALSSLQSPWGWSGWRSLWSG